MLGVDGDLTLKDVKKKRDSTLKKEKRKIDMLYLAVNHFEQKMIKRRKLLDNCIEQSKRGAYKRMVNSHKGQYQELLKFYEDN